MGRPISVRAMIRGIVRKREAEIRAEEEATEAALQSVIAAGPPKGMDVPQKAWADWNRYGFVACPGDIPDRACYREECRCGSRCAKMSEKGLQGDGSPMPRKARPACGAKTRAGGACAVRVEPGKHRCRFHGGMSTGPRTAEGRERVAQAQRDRWARMRAAPATPAPI